jgi:hypothetical protein
MLAKAKAKAAEVEKAAKEAAAEVEKAAKEAAAAADAKYALPPAAAEGTQLSSALSSVDASRPAHACLAYLRLRVLLCVLRVGHGALP